MQRMLVLPIRLLALMMVLLCTVAVGIGRMFPPARVRLMTGATAISIHNHTCGLMDRVPRLLAPSTRGMIRLDLPSGDSLDWASVSPWRDLDGRAQVVGRWMGHSGSPGDLASRGIGLGRFTYPGGEPLDRIETDRFPMGPPCWLPGTTARVLFAARDARLYRIDFEESPGRPIRDGAPAPVRLRWEVDGLPEDRVRIAEPAWPDSPRFRDTILVSLSRKEVSGSGRPRFSPEEIWWLRLDPARTAIVAAGPVTGLDVAPGAGPRPEQRYPSLVETADGELYLGYLAQPGRGRGASLRVAPLRFDGDPGVPVLAAPSHVVAERCCLSPPIFAKDGRSILCMTLTDSPEGAILVVDLDIGPDGSMLAARRRSGVELRPSS